MRGVEWVRRTIGWGRRPRRKRGCGVGRSSRSERGTCRPERRRRPLRLGLAVTPVLLMTRTLTIKETVCKSLVDLVGETFQLAFDLCSSSAAIQVSYTIIERRLRRATSELSETHGIGRLPEQLFSAVSGIECAAALPPSARIARRKSSSATTCRSLLMVRSACTDLTQGGNGPSH